MSTPTLKDIVRRLIMSHPSISESTFGHAAHAERFITAKGAPLALEPKRTRFENLWVRADSVDTTRLSDIEQTYFDCAQFSESKPNHDLYGEHAFKETDLIRYRIHSPWQAVRVIAEVAGDGSKS
jgi:hypothetical protein